MPFCGSVSLSHQKPNASGFKGIFFGKGYEIPVVCAWIWLSNGWVVSTFCQQLFSPTDALKRTDPYREWILDLHSSVGHKHNMKQMIYWLKNSLSSSLSGCVNRQLLANIKARLLLALSRCNQMETKQIFTMGHLSRFEPWTVAVDVYLLQTGTRNPSFLPFLPPSSFFSFPWSIFPVPSQHYTFIKWAYKAPE